MNNSLNINENTFNRLISAHISSIEMNLLYIITITGILINVLTMIYLLITATYKMKSSCFLFHHCVICLILSILCLPYSLSFSNYSIRCDYLGNIQVTCVTAQLLNMAAMVANEAYSFEDLIHQDASNDNNAHSKKSYRYELKQSNKSTISCGCLSFGILIIWFSSIILHLGKFSLFFSVIDKLLKLEIIFNFSIPEISLIERTFQFEINFIIRHFLHDELNFRLILRSD